MRVNGHQRKITKIRLTAGVCFILAVIMTFFIAENSFSESPKDIEGKAVLKAARTFLDAEIRRDYPAVYACFAPSSPYTQTHDYKQYLAETRVTPERVVAYQIIRVSYIQDNNFSQTTTPADKIAQVEVEVTFLNEGTRQRSVVNIGFIFLKEGGKWYKS